MMDSAGIYIPQQRVGFKMAQVHGTGTITYRCHTCGELIPRYWEVLFVDDTPGREWASLLVPPVLTPRTTTHHDWHLAATQ